VFTDGPAAAVALAALCAGDGLADVAGRRFGAGALGRLPWSRGKVGGPNGEERPGPPAARAARGGRRRARLRGEAPGSGPAASWGLPRAAPTPRPRAPRGAAQTWAGSLACFAGAWAAGLAALCYLRAAGAPLGASAAAATPGGLAAGAAAAALAAALVESLPLREVDNLTVPLAAGLAAAAAFPR
jgi:dolichol kinase